MIHRFIDGCKVGFYDIKLCLWLWFLYFKYAPLRHKYEGKELFHSSFKNDNTYTKICYNTKLIFPEVSLCLPYFRLFKTIAKWPLLFFYRFPNQENNYQPNRDTSLSYEASKLHIKTIKPFTYFEGISFHNFIFDHLILKSVCFHNCSFFNCEFLNLYAPISTTSPIKHPYKQGFSACSFDNCHFKECLLHNTFFSIGSLYFVTFEDTHFCDCVFHRMSFKRVHFKGESSFNETCIYSPSQYFDISFLGSAEAFSVDAKSRIVGFSYHDIINLQLDNYNTYNVFKKDTYAKVADTYFALDQVWASNHIREQDNHRVNLYYQRKKAETRSKKGLSALFGYLSEWTIGYGEKPFRAFASIFVLVLLFSFIYIFTGFTPDSASSPIGYFYNCTLTLNDWLQSLFFSFFTLVTVGQGSAAPASAASQIAMSLELLFGAILMTLFTGTLFRKYTK